MIEDNASAQHPLRGAVLCSTALSQDVKAKVGIIGAELGAVHKLDLTTDVTHLLIGSVDSEKYRHVAKRRPDILVLQPEWLFAVRDAWMQGDEIDLNRLNEQFRLPTFHSLNICVTGFSDPRQRQWIEATAKDNGAQYHGDLTRAVTHLIAADPKGAKYDRAKQWSIKIVSLEWFDRSLERRMILDESTFDPLIEQGKRGEGAYQPQVKRPTTGKRGRTDETDSGTVNAKRKLRRTASARLSSQSQNMWQDITTTEGQASFLEDSWTQSVDPERRPPEPTVETQPIPEGLSRSLSNMANSKALFAGWTCLIHGHSAQVSSKLRQLLSDNGASIVDRADMLKDPTIDWSAVILPSAWTGKPDSVVPQVPLETKQVTEWWVERCLAHKTILDPDKDVFSQAMLHVPGNCLQDLFISASGFGQDVRYVARIVQAAGGSYEEGVTRKVNLLIFKHSNDLDKPVYCAERNIDVVSPEWFFSSLREGRAQPVYPFMLPRHLCDAIQQIINSRRRSDTQGDAKKDGNQKTDTKRLVAQRLSGLRKQGPTPALALARRLPTMAVKAPTAAEKQKALEEVASNSQERRESWPTPSTEKAVQNGNLDHQQDKENDYSNEESGAKNEQKPARPSAQEVCRQTSDLLTGIMAKRQTSSATNIADEVRPKRKLGRAPSGNSMNSFMRQSASPFIEEDGADMVEAPLPSQQLTYEAPGAAEHRRLMSKKMGTKFEEAPGLKVESLKSAKDVGSGNQGVGARVRGRHRDGHHR